MPGFMGTISFPRGLYQVSSLQEAMSSVPPPSKEGSLLPSAVCAALDYPCSGSKVSLPPLGDTPRQSLWATAHGKSLTISYSFHRKVTHFHSFHWPKHGTWPDEPPPTTGLEGVGEWR
jgi:hypothetical protein